MKRKKDEEKVKGGLNPMFPRLHVNNTERVGPRAPPRNKMALYEQLSIPSQRFTSSDRTSSYQGSENKMPMFPPLHLPRSAPQADNSNVTSSAPQKRVNEEDFTVPVFVQPEKGENNNKYNGVDGEIVPLSGLAQVICSSREQSAYNKEQKENSTTVSGSRQEEKEHLTDDVERLQTRTTYALNDEIIEVSQLISVQKGVFNEECHKDESGYLSGLQNGDRCDDDSDTSMLDSVSAVYITPDDVVGLIGQKHFWKARRAIVNQQRVFAVQVFELHRLIKVQKLFAGSPNLSHEDSAFPGKSLKTFIPKQISLEFIVKPPGNLEINKDNHLNYPSRKTEGSAENAVEKNSISSSHNVSQNHPLNQLPCPSNPQSTSVTAEPSTNPWSLNQPTGHHWLVPVMSPTEGLIYKPYPGPAHTGSNPMVNNFPYPPFAMPNSHPSMSHHGYFPPYAMPRVGAAFSGNHFMGDSHSDQQEDSCTGPMQNDPNMVKTWMISKDSGLQASPTNVSRGERKKLHSFQMTSGDVATEKVARVIKVVPRDAVSANETAFRIFQSIQKEREQYESV